MKETLFNWQKTLHLVRGLPGEGKSTLALKLVNGDRRKVVENDEFWFVPTRKDHWNAAYGPYLHENYNSQNKNYFEYKYTQEMTHLAAQWCSAEAFRRLRIFDEVAVANTFVKREHILPWIEQARKLGVNVQIHRPTTEWVGDTAQSFARNIHGVPQIRIEQMKEQWEEFTQSEVDVLLGKTT